MELNAILGGRSHPANVQEKLMHNTGEMPWNRSDPRSDAAIYFLFLVGRIMEYIIKRPARDACLCMGELPALPAPHFVFLITL